jgi:hypothetical protein
MCGEEHGGSGRDRTDPGRRPVSTRANGPTVWLDASELRWRQGVPGRQASDDPAPCIRASQPDVLLVVNRGPWLRTIRVVGLSMSCVTAPDQVAEWVNVFSALLSTSAPSSRMIARNEIKSFWKAKSSLRS